MPGTVVTLTALGAAIIPKITPKGTYRQDSCQAAWSYSLHAGVECYLQNPGQAMPCCLPNTLCGSHLLRGKAKVLTVATVPNEPEPFGFISCSLHSSCRLMPTSVPMHLLILQPGMPLPCLATWLIPSPPGPFSKRPSLTILVLLAFSRLTLSNTAAASHLWLLGT